MLVLTHKGSVKSYPYSFSRLKLDNPQVSFPATPSSQLLEEFSIYPVTRKDPPEFNPATHSLREVNPKLVEGEWVQNWLLEELSEEKLEIRRLDAAAAAREKRSALLAESDWTQVADAPVDASAWRSYRTELRNITEQEGFPHNIVWPARPSN